MKFNYQARTKNGEARTGTIEAASKESAVELLQKYGLYVTLLEEAKKSPLYTKKIKFLGRVSTKDVVLFSQQLSIMFHAKVPLVEALRTLASQIKKQDFKEKIIKISEEIEGGTALSLALGKYPKIFSPFYIAMTRAGEAAGKLSESLSYLAEHLDKEYHLKNKIIGAMIYPGLITFVALSVLVLMIVFVIPQFKEILESSGQELPLVTKIVLAFSDFVKKWGWIFILSFIPLIIFIVRFSKTKRGKKFFDKFFLSLPVIGPFLKMIYIARFAENLSTLISGGLPIARALEITGEIVGNTVYKEIILQTRDGVRKGESISSILALFPNEFTPVFIQMALVGERTGTLEKTLINVVEFYQKEIDRTMENLISILEPALLVFLGVVVGGMMVSVLLPLYQVSSSAGG